MTIEHAPSTNGHVKHAATPPEQKIYRPAAERMKRETRIRARKLLLPLALLFGVLMILRYFEQATAD
jgi:hypothetical protein